MAEVVEATEEVTEEVETEKVVTYPLTIEHEGFTQKYTKVVALEPKNFNAHHWYSVESADTGAQIQSIHFQEGPIKENGINGVANEDLILMVVDRLESFQESEYACDENAEAIEHLMEAITSLRSRTTKREERGVEGTSEV